MRTPVRRSATAVELNPKSYDAHVGLGAALRGLNDAEGAKKQYEEAKGIAATRPEAYFNLGILYQDFMSGSVADMKQALSYYDQFVQRAGGNAALKPVVDDIERRCGNEDAKKKRKSSKTCRPGRRQNIQLAIEAMAAMAEMEKQARGNPACTVSRSAPSGARVMFCSRAQAPAIDEVSELFESRVFWGTFGWLSCRTQRGKG